MSGDPRLLETRRKVGNLMILLGSGTQGWFEFANVTQPKSTDSLPKSDSEFSTIVDAIATSIAVAGRLSPERAHQ